MMSFARSFLTAFLITAAVLLFTVRILAPVLPSVVGPPDIRDQRSFKLQGSKTLWLSSHDGAVRIRAVDNPENDQIIVRAEIKVYVHDKSKMESLRPFLDSLVQATSTPDSLRILTEPQERPDSIDVRVDYEIQVPLGTDIEIAGANGNIWISKGCGRIEINGDNSDIEVVEPSGPVIAKNTNGRIRILDAWQDTELETVNGNIYAHMRAGALRASTANGHIVAHVLSDAVSSFDLSSQNGGVTVVLGDEPSIDFDALTGRGSIRSDYLIGESLGIQPSKHIRGVLGRGDTRLTIETLNGNIWFARG